MRSKGSDRLLCLACRLPPRLPSQSPSDHSLFECSQDIRIALMPSRVRLPFYFMRTTKKHSPFDECFAIWCGRRDLTACGALLAGCLLGSPLGRLRTIRYSSVHRTFELRSCPRGFESLLFSYENKKTSKMDVFLFWCGRRDSNPHGRPHGPEPCASANSATTAYLIVPLSCGTIIIIQHLFINCNENFMIFLNFSF